MTNSSRLMCIAAILAWASAGFPIAAAASDETPTQPEAAPAPKPALDRSGHKRSGKASFYSNKFAGKKMADGTLMRPHGDNAASKTLPLGTTAKVTNLETGRSAVVTIQDRGPYVKGRIVDLSPDTARKIGMDTDSGVAKVEVAPITVPMADGTLKAGAAITDANKKQPPH
jgi:rare lipoprotein A